LLLETLLSSNREANKGVEGSQASLLRGANFIGLREANKDVEGSQTSLLRGTNLLVSKKSQRQGPQEKPVFIGLRLKID